MEMTGLRDVGSLPTPRAAHTATRLDNGTVLITGGCVEDGCEPGDETATGLLYDPITARFGAAGRMNEPRNGGHSATLLPDGRVLLAGGWVGSRPTTTVELYDPEKLRFVSANPMREARADHTATLLSSGKVLITGGYDGTNVLSSAELFDPVSGTFSATESMTTPRAIHGAAHLPGGQVLITGGMERDGFILRTAEIYDARTGRFEATNSLSVPRYKHLAIALSDRTVLVAGGSDWEENANSGLYTSAEVFNPADGTFRAVGSMHEGRYKFYAAAAELPDGNLLIAGGGRFPEIYDPETGRFHLSKVDLLADWSFLTATTLGDESVLLVGGYDEQVKMNDQVWIYTAEP